jgi:hypothetical protein
MLFVDVRYEEEYMAYRHVTGEERRHIYEWRQEGCRIRTIARLLRRGRGGPSLTGMRSFVAGPFRRVEQPVFNRGARFSPGSGCVRGERTLFYPPSPRPSPPIHWGERESTQCDISKSIDKK